MGHITITYSRLWIVRFTVGVFVRCSAVRFHATGLNAWGQQNRSWRPRWGIRTATIDALLRTWLPGLPASQVWR